MAGVLNDMYIDSNLVYLDLDAKTDQEALDKMAHMFLDQGHVKESFIEAVKSREIDYSTGLQCEDIGVAIPHTDSEHVNNQVVGIGILKKPVNFKQMGTPDVEVAVKIIIMLAIKEPHKQLDFLQALMEIFMDKGKLLALSSCKLQEEAVKTFKAFFA